MSAEGCRYNEGAFSESAKALSFNSKVIFLIPQQVEDITDLEKEVSTISNTMTTFTALPTLNHI